MYMCVYVYVYIHIYKNKKQFSSLVKEMVVKQMNKHIYNYTF